MNRDISMAFASYMFWDQVVRAQLIYPPWPEHELWSYPPVTILFWISSLLTRHDFNTSCDLTYPSRSWFESQVCLTIMTLIRAHHDSWPSLVDSSIRVPSWLLAEAYWQLYPCSIIPSIGITYWSIFILLIAGHHETPIHTQAVIEYL